MQFPLLEGIAAADCPATAVRYSSTSAKVYVTGPVSCTLTDLDAVVSNAVLERTDATGKVWILRKHVALQEGAALILHGDSAGGDVNELRLLSNSTFEVSVRADYGAIDIDGVRITSWDESIGAVDTNHSDGRAFISVRSRLDAAGVPRESRMDIRNSEIAYLGYNASESYGLSWKVIGSSAGLFDQVDVFGDVIDNYVHHCYFGGYTYGALGMQWIGNRLENNVKYGLDPHDDSDDMVVVDNDIGNNGYHGFICSKRCDGLEIRDNRAWNNAGNGFMLHSQITNSVMEGNESWGNTDAGIALFEASDIEVRDNYLHDNKRGIRLSVASNDNVIENNVIDGNEYGIYLYKGADTPAGGGDAKPRRNTIINNSVSDNGRGVSLDQADENQFIGNTFGPSSFDDAYSLVDGMGNVFAGNVIPADDRIHVKTTNLLDANLTITQAGFPAEAQGPLLVDVSNAAEVFLVETSGLSHQVTGLSTANLATSSESRLTMISSSARLVVAHPIFARPASGTVKLTPTSATAWKAQSTTGSLSTTFTIGKLQPGAIYAVKKNGSSFTTVTASDGGVASFIDTVGTTTISYTISPQ